MSARPELNEWDTRAHVKTQGVVSLVCLGPTVVSIPIEETPRQDLLKILDSSAYQQSSLISWPST